MNAKCQSGSPGCLRSSFIIHHSSFITSLALALSSACPAWAQTDAQYRTQRLHMVEAEIAREGIENERVLEALRKVPRHQFVPSPYRTRAYQDSVLPIGFKQTISPPYIVAYMTEVLDPQPGDKVLEIGTGSGYQAAVLAEICKEVFTIEIVEPLGKQAAALKELGYNKVQVKIGDGYKGWPEHAPFDKIIVTCSPETVPQPLIDQLKEGGKMLLPLGERYQQVFVLLEKQKGQLVRTRLVPTFFVAMTGKAEDDRQVKPDGIPHLLNGGFEKHTNFLPDNWYCKRQVTISQVGAAEGSSFAQFVNDEPGRSSGLFQGMSVDGKKIKTLRLNAKVRGESIQSGPDQRNDVPTFSLIFLDGSFNKLDIVHYGAIHGTFKWTAINKTFPVPEDTQVAVLRIGLNGGTGSMGVDDVRITPGMR